MKSTSNQAQRSPRHQPYLDYVWILCHSLALVVQVKEEHAPRSHNLIYLAECANLTLSDSQREILTRVNKYNLETRYPVDRDA